MLRRKNNILSCLTWNTSQGLSIDSYFDVNIISSLLLQRKLFGPTLSGGSTELCYSSRKIGSELKCALCEVTATSERGFQEHLAGKKHKAKAACLITSHTGKTKNCVMESSLKSCKLGASDKKVVTKRKKHSKNLKRRRKSRGKTC